MYSLICFIQGHKIVCEEAYVFTPDNNAYIEHIHQCARTRCGKVTHKEILELDIEFIDLLNALVRPNTKVTTRVGTDPFPHNIH